MYGIVIENVHNSLKLLFGLEMCEAIRRKANVHCTAFESKRQYSETVILRLARAAHEVTGKPHDALMESFGARFIHFAAANGYERILTVLGRSLRDFINNLDNLHEYLRYGYPRIDPPSFAVTDESATGLTVHYRSKRKGFASYVQGQLKEVARYLYGAELRVSSLKSVESFEWTVHEMRLTFDNVGVSRPLHGNQCDADFSISPPEFFSLFPFHVVFDYAMTVTSVGRSLASIMPRLLGCQIDDMFNLQRPATEFSLQAVISHGNNVFQLQSVEEVPPYCDEKSSTVSDNLSCTSASCLDEESWRDFLECRVHNEEGHSLILRGEMINMNEWKSVLFLGTPVLENLHAMSKLGLYVTDLSIHDSSRDLILVESQREVETKLLLDEEWNISRKVEENARKLRDQKTRVKELLYHNVPKPVADRLRRGEHASRLCEMFEICTVMFGNVIGIKRACDASTPVKMVSALNKIQSCYDALIKDYDCHKIETLGGKYMAVGGAPIRSSTHATNIIDMAIAMLSSTAQLTLSTDDDEDARLTIRIGVHSGSVVAGVVGLRTPKYCLFGETVDIARSLETAGKAMKIHISQATKAFLPDDVYATEENDRAETKVQQCLKTYWLRCPSVGQEQSTAARLLSRARIDDHYRSGERAAGFSSQTVGASWTAPSYSQSGAKLLEQ